MNFKILTMFTLILVYIWHFDGIQCQPSTATPGLIDGAYCRPDAVIPARFPGQCKSCRARCGLPRDLYGGHYCSCDNKCGAYGDCCFDFQDLCPSQQTEGSKISEHFKYRHNVCLQMKTVSVVQSGIYKPEISNKTFEFISVCGQSGVYCMRNSFVNLNKPNLALPVTDQQTGLVYINYNCAKCNGVSQIHIWEPTLFCDPHNYQYQEGQTLIQDYATLHRYRGCTIYYSVPKTTEPRIDCARNAHRNIIKSCPVQCSNLKLKQQCENSSAVDYVRSSNSDVYSNRYCALCNDVDLLDLQCPTFGMHESFVVEELERFSLSLVFDFNSEQGINVGKWPCPPLHKVIHGFGMCSHVGCPADQRLVESHCLPLTARSKFATVSWSFIREIDLLKVKRFLNKGNLKSKLELHMAKKLLELSNNDPMKQVDINITQQSLIYENAKINVTYFAVFRLDTHSTINLFDLMFLTNTTAAYLKKQILHFLDVLKIDEGNVTVLVNGIYGQTIFDDCNWHLFDENEYISRKKSLILKESKRKYRSEKFILLDGQAIVCIMHSWDDIWDDIMDDVWEEFEEYDWDDFADDLLGNMTDDIIDYISEDLVEDVLEIVADVQKYIGIYIVQLTLMSLSVICLLIRIVLQFFLSNYNSFPAKMQFNLALALCLTFIMHLIDAGFIVRPAITEPLCAALGVLTYWFFLAAFFWMAAIAIDTWQAFKPSNEGLNAAASHKSLLWYTVPCWSFSAFLALLAFGLDYAEFDLRFKPHFGDDVCWFNQEYADIVWFETPVGVSCLISLVFFLLTVRNIWYRQRNQVIKQSSREGHQFCVYIRLFVLMGISWMWNFLAAHVEHDAVLIIQTILNSSQGVLLCISSVCRKVIFTEIRNKWKVESGNKGSTQTTGSPQSSSKPKRKMNDTALQVEMKEM